MKKSREAEKMKFALLLLVIVIGFWLRSKAEAIPLPCAGKPADKISPQDKNASQADNAEGLRVKRDDLEEKILPQLEQDWQEVKTETLEVEFDDLEDKILPQDGQVLEEDKMETVVVKREDVEDKVLPQNEQFSPDQKPENVTVKSDDSAERILLQFGQASEEEITETVTIKTDDSTDRILLQFGQGLEEQNTETVTAKSDDLEDSSLPQGHQVSQEEATVRVKRDSLEAEDEQLSQEVNTTETESSEKVSGEANTNLELLLEDQEFELEFELEFGEGNETATSPVRRSVNLTRSIRVKRIDLDASNETLLSEEYDVNKTAKHSFRDALLRKLLVNKESIVEDNSNETHASVKANLEKAEIDEQEFNETDKRPVRRSLLAVTNFDEVTVTPSTSTKIVENAFLKLFPVNEYFRTKVIYISCTCVIFPYYGGKNGNTYCDDLPIISNRIVRVTDEETELSRKEECLRKCTDSAGIYLKRSITADCVPSFSEDEMEPTEANVNRVICNIASRDCEEMDRKLSKWQFVMLFNLFVFLSVLFMVLSYYIFCRKQRQIRVYHALNLVKLRAKTEAPVAVECK